MKTIKARIVEYTDSTPFTEQFSFPSEEDKKAFFELIGNGDNCKVEIRGKIHPAPHRAWDLLHKANYYHIGYEHEPFCLIWAFPETDVELLEILLKFNDWYTDYSDDYRVISGGDSQRARINQLMQKVGDPLAQELYDKYCPYNKEK